jgi:hypothetical protein
LGIYRWVYIQSYVVNLDFHGYGLEFWTRETLEMKIYRNLIAMAAAAAAMTFAAQAHANSINFFLTTPETGSPPTNPVEVTVTTGSISMGVFTAGGVGPFTAAQVTFTNPTSANMAPVELNVSGPFTATGNDGITTASGCCGEGASKFGTMNLETGSGSINPIIITLTAGSGNSWANALAVLTPDSKGFEALAAFGTGIQDGGFATPLPAALPLFATGLGGLGLLGWRRKRKAAAAA